MAHHRRRSQPAPASTTAAEDPPVVRNGYVLMVWPEFKARWDALVAEVEMLRQKDPANYRTHPTARFLALLVRIVLHDVPQDPGADRYRQGKTMGGAYKQWRRAKFASRFRLFFRYRSKPPMIAYVWLNDESTLRRAGDRTDVYAVFKAKLEQDKPPSGWDDLMRACQQWTERAAATPRLEKAADEGTASA